MIVTKIHPETQEENKLNIKITHNQLTIIENGGDLDGININQDELRFIQTGLLPDDDYEDQLDYYYDN